MQYVLRINLPLRLKAIFHKWFSLFFPSSLLTFLHFFHTLFPHPLSSAMQLSQSEETSRMFSVQCRRLNVPFFRFNPALMEVISPGETNDKKLVDMLLQTRLYLHRADTQEELVRMVTLMKHLAQIQPSRAQT